MTTITKKTRTYSKIHPLHKKRLRELAEKHGQKWVGERLGMGTSGISRLLMSGDHGVRPKTLEGIIELVGKNGFEASGSHPARPPMARTRVRTGDDQFTATSAVMAALEPLSVEARQNVLTAVLKLIDVGVGE